MPFDFSGVTSANTPRQRQPKSRHGTALETLAQDIATCLGQDHAGNAWQVRGTELPHCVLLQRGRQQLLLMQPWQSNRLTLEGCFPAELQPYYNPQEPKACLSVSIGKSPSRIAEAIQRRLLPAYEAAWQKRVESQDVSQQRSVEVQQLAARLTSASGGTFQPKNAGSAATVVLSEGNALTSCELHAKTNHFSGNITVRQDSVHLTLQGLGPELAERILQVIRDYQAQSRRP